MGVCVRTVPIVDPSVCVSRWVGVHAVPSLRVGVPIVDPLYVCVYSAYSGPPSMCVCIVLIVDPPYRVMDTAEV